MKLQKQNCAICEKETSRFLNICDDCILLLDKKNAPVVRNFRYVDDAYSCYVYNQVMADIIYRYKFGGKRYLKYALAELMCEKILEERLYKYVDLIISVPVHKDTLNRRGFNQVELLEDIISEQFSIDQSKNNLIKIKSTREQTELSVLERTKNLLDVFFINRPEEIENQRVLLLDDIITTGSTLDECAKILKNRGAENIIALSVASSR